MNAWRDFRWHLMATGVLALAFASACGDSEQDEARHSDPDAESDVEGSSSIDQHAESHDDETEADGVNDASDDVVEPNDAAGDVTDAAGDGDPSDAGDANVGSCSSCHGSAANAAPPKDTNGGISPSLPGVGAHQSHLSNSGIFRVVECNDCHSVPSAGDTSHADGLPAELSWSAIATSDQVQASYASGKCSVYCHGVSLAGGSVSEPIWTAVDGSQAYCGSCHGVPPPEPHPKLSQLACSPCHSGWNGVMPTKPSLHVDGKLDVIACGQCHAVPPATGAHAAHYSDASTPPLAFYGDTRTVADYYPSGAPGYMFGCGNCHPLDGSLHANGKLEVELTNPSAPPNSLKAKSPASASYAGGACNNVYCHSSGQATPTYVATPAWSGGKLPLNHCAACHGNPPDYSTGGAGSATANTHVVLADDGWELGHFGGMPGPWHTSYHGGSGVGAAPITCQTCHYDSVDPNNVGPGGFYYLDTTGDYDLGGSLGYSCTACHSGQSGAPAQKSGAVVTKKHVNGTRDVVFDPRTTIPSSVTGLPAAPNRPSLPYWVTATPSTLPPGSAVDGSTWSLTLAGASYDPLTKTCSKVACHLKQSFGTGNPQYEPLTWGSAPVGYATCSSCHQP